MKIQEMLAKPGLKILLILLPIALLFNQWATVMLNESYAQSLFPVPYYEAQLTFNGEKIKEYYQFLIENDTLQIYRTTQYIDFIFIVSTLFFHGTLTLLALKMFSQGSILYRLGIFSCLIAPLAPIFDSLENVVSFFMLANPITFANGLAMIYSAFAALKFAVFMLTYAWLLFSLFYLIFKHILGKAKKASSL